MTNVEKNDSLSVEDRGKTAGAYEEGPVGPVRHWLVKWVSQ
jgi:hypothetical protein